MKYNFIPKRILLATKARGLSIAELAEKIYVNKSTVYYWIKNDRYPGVDHVADIANALDVPIEYFFDALDTIDPTHDDDDTCKFIVLGRYNGHELYGCDHCKIPVDIKKPKDHYCKHCGRKAI